MPHGLGIQKHGDTIHLNTQSKLYNGVMMLITGFVFAFSVANAVYYSKLRSRPSPAISTSAASAMLGINIVLSILGGIGFVWTAYRLFVGKEKRAAIFKNARERARGFFREQQGAEQIPMNDFVSGREMQSLDQPYLQNRRGNFDRRGGNFDDWEN